MLVRQLALSMKTWKWRLSSKFKNKVQNKHPSLLASERELRKSVMINPFNFKRNLHSSLHQVSVWVPHVSSTCLPLYRNSLRSTSRFNKHSSTNSFQIFRNFLSAQDITKKSPPNVSTKEDGMTKCFFQTCVRNVHFHWFYVYALHIFLLGVLDCQILCSDQ